MKAINSVEFDADGKVIRMTFEFPLTAEQVAQLHREYQDARWPRKTLAASPPDALLDPIVSIRPLP